MLYTCLQEHRLNNSFSSTHFFLDLLVSARFLNITVVPWLTTSSTLYQMDWFIAINSQWLKTSRFDFDKLINIRSDLTLFDSTTFWPASVSNEFACYFFVTYCTGSFLYAFVSTSYLCWINILRTHSSLCIINLDDTTIINFVILFKLSGLYRFHSKYIASLTRRKQFLRSHTARFLSFAEILLKSYMVGPNCKENEKLFSWEREIEEKRKKKKGQM